MTWNKTIDDSAVEILDKYGYVVFSVDLQPEAELIHFCGYFKIGNNIHIINENEVTVTDDIIIAEKKISEIKPILEHFGTNSTGRRIGYRYKDTFDNLTIKFSFGDLIEERNVKFSINEDRFSLDLNKLGKGVGYILSDISYKFLVSNKIILFDNNCKTFCEKTFVLKNNKEESYSDICIHAHFETINEKNIRDSNNVTCNLFIHDKCEGKEKNDIIYHIITSDAL